MTAIIKFHHRSVAGPLPTRGASNAFFVSKIRLENKPRVSTAPRASGDEGDKNDLSEQFQKELQRRANEEATTTTSRGAPRPSSPPPPFAGSGSRSTEQEDAPQLERSRALNSEGLEGFFPRASELLKLGLSFFLAFGPFIVAVALVFGAVYGVFGSSFVHGGQPNSAPQYIDPQELLSEPTVDPMIPM